MQGKAPNPIIIEIPPVDGKTFRILKDGVQRIELHEGIAVNIQKGLVENPPDKKDDTDEIEELINGNREWKQKQTDWNYFTFKKNISCVDFYYTTSDDVYVLSISIHGRADDWLCYFKHRDEALIIQEKILNWLLQK